MNTALLKGSQFIDIHYHAAPDFYKRRYSAFEAGKVYQGYNGVVVLKSHLGSTAEVAYVACSEGLPVLGSIGLNAIGGGIDYRRVLAALGSNPSDEVRLVVDLPTITDRKHRSVLSRECSKSYLANYTTKGEALLDDNGRLRSEVLDILRLSLDYPIVVTSGHASKEEVYSLVEACNTLGVDRFLLNQPANPLTSLRYDELAELSRHDFLWVEQTALTVLLGYQMKEDFNQVVSKLPRVIYSSDLGQKSQIGVQEWLVQSKVWFDTIGLTNERVREVCFLNPMKLLT